MFIPAKTVACTFMDARRQVGPFHGVDNQPEVGGRCKRVLDLLNVTFQAVQLDAFNIPLGASILILTMFVPALWISSITIFYLLLTRRNSA